MLKKLISLMLVLLTCVGLVACSNEVDYGKYSDLIAYIKEGDRESAYKELD